MLLIVLILLEPQNMQNLEHAVIKVKGRMHGFYTKQITVPCPGGLPKILVTRMKVQERGVDLTQPVQAEVPARIDNGDEKGVQGKEVGVYKEGWGRSSVERDREREEGVTTTPPARGGTETRNAEEVARRRKEDEHRQRGERTARAGSAERAGRSAAGEHGARDKLIGRRRYVAGSEEHDGGHQTSRRRRREVLVKEEVVFLIWFRYVY
ncbi:hypothetical protein Syun_006082 [Stephania yunnanensis]|uniref:Uncharacterized protein n=1 Tax=Stephania yunnanensis TaxID=152371 RepID=A0AAP0KW01_9MAGN